MVPWYGVKKHYLAILACLQSTFPHNDDATSKIKQKATLKAAKVSKKIKFLDHLVVAVTARIIELRDQRLIQQEKANAETKAWIKKAVDAEKKEKKKTDKVREKNQQ